MLRPASVLIYHHFLMNSDQWSTHTIKYCQEFPVVYQALAVDFAQACFTPAVLTQGPGGHSSMYQPLLHNL